LAVDQIKESKLTAIATHARLTYGLSRSPILADFQKTPMMPSLFLSIIEGKMAWMYVDVQTKSRITSRSDWKLKIAVMVGVGVFLFGR
jgi:hypothetical protein